jgi:hypothetical protein
MMARLLILLILLLLTPLLLPRPLVLPLRACCCWCLPADLWAIKLGVKLQILNHIFREALVELQACRWACTQGGAGVESAGRERRQLGAADGTPARIPGCSEYDGSSSRVASYP